MKHIHLFESWPLWEQPGSDEPVNDRPYNIIKYEIIPLLKSTPGVLASRERDPENIDIVSRWSRSPRFRQNVTEAVYFDIDHLTDENNHGMFVIEHYDGFNEIFLCHQYIEVKRGRKNLPGIPIRGADDLREVLEDIMTSMRTFQDLVDSPLLRDTPEGMQRFHDLRGTITGGRYGI